MYAHACECTSYGRCSYIFPKSQSEKVKYASVPKGLEAYNEVDYFLKTVF